MPPTADKNVILRLPLQAQDSRGSDGSSDSESEFILVKVSRRSRDTTTDLDLRLFATEGEAVYRASIKSSQINRLRSKTYQGSDEEWKGMLSYVLGQRGDSDHENDDGGTTEDWKDSLEVSASVRQSESAKNGGDEENEIVISLRKRVQRITQRLGTITLRQTDDDISLFDWAGLAARRTQKLKTQMLVLGARSAAAEQKASFFEGKLHELVNAKKQHEDELIEKFAKLLNEKKLEIRNQQRILGGDGAGGGDAAEIQALQQARESEQSKKSAGRRGKRKAEENIKSETTQQNEAETSDDAFEDAPPTRGRAPEFSPQTSHDEETAEEDNEEDGKRETPQPMEDETEAEAEQQDEDEEMRSETSSATSFDKQPRSNRRGRKNNNVKPAPSKPAKGVKGRTNDSQDRIDDHEDSSTDEDFEAVAPKRGSRSGRAAVPSQSQSQQSQQRQHGKEPPARRVSARSAAGRHPQTKRSPAEEEENEGSETQSDNDGS